MSGPRMEGLVAVIAGAGVGIGRSCGLKLAADGADVVVAARRPGPLAELAGEIAATGRRSLAVPTDLADLEQCRALIDTTVERFGRVDAVVNVATRSAPRAPVEQGDWEEYRAAFELNVIATLEVSRAAARYMQGHGGGSIVQISTLSVRSLRPQMAAYSATKGAMEVASRTMARELGPSGVRVNVVVPGFTTGPSLHAMFETIAARRGVDVAEVYANASAETWLGRLVDPDDIAEAVAFLASPRARNITGAVLDVTAGLSLG